MADGCLIGEMINSEISLLLPFPKDSIIYSHRERVTTQGSLMFIEIPPKVWIPKVQNRYIPAYYANDIYKGVFYF